MISEFFDEKYFLYQVKHKGNGDVDSIELGSPLLKSKDIDPQQIFSYYYFRCEADLMESSTKDKDVRKRKKDQYGKATNDPDPKDHSSSHKDKIQKQYNPSFQQKDYWQKVPIVEEKAFENFPKFSWLLSLKIELEEPFLSHGDDPFYPVENSVCKDAGSGLPMIKSTTWKGNFLDAAYHLYCSQLPELALIDWTSKEEILKNTKISRIEEIIKEHGSLKECPLYAIEEMYQIMLKEKGKEWFDLRKEAKKDSTILEKYQQHPLTILHELRGYAVGWLTKLCGTEDEIYDQDSNDSKSKHFHLPISSSTDMDLDQKQCPQQGRLFFFPSYFDTIGFDVIAPVERKGRTVKQPILMEVIPKGCTSTLTIFYLADEHIKEKEAARDLRFCLDIIETMLQETGFSAKKSTGYGQAKILPESKCYFSSKKWEVIEEKKTQETPKQKPKEEKNKKTKSPLEEDWKQQLIAKKSCPKISREFSCENFKKNIKEIEEGNYDALGKKE